MENDNQIICDIEDYLSDYTEIIFENTCRSIQKDWAKERERIRGEVVRCFKKVWEKTVSLQDCNRKGTVKYWLMLYDGPTIVGFGDCYMFADIYAEHCPGGYGALQGYGGGKSCLNKNGGHTTYGGMTELDKDKGTVLYNDIERHAVAIGPSLQNTDFDTLITKIDAKDMAYGTCLDVTIELNGKTYYIPAVITDVKAHTLVLDNVGDRINKDSGYFQTNIAFDKSIEDGGKGQNIVEWYVRQGEDSKNKSTGLKEFDSSGGIIIYRDEIMD